LLQLDWQEQNSPVKGFDVTNYTASSLIFEQFMTHPEAVNLRTEPDCILVDARISTPYSNVIAGQMHTENIKHQILSDYIY